MSTAKPAKPATAPATDEAPRHKKTPEASALEKAGALLEPAFADEGTRPLHGTSRVAGPGPFPRVCHQLERAAGSGMKRFKLRCDNYTGQALRYVLAADEESAKACYLKVQALDKLLDRLRKENPGKEPDKPGILCWELPD